MSGLLPNADDRHSHCCMHEMGMHLEREPHLHTGLAHGCNSAQAPLIRVKAHSQVQQRPLKGVQGVWGRKALHAGIQGCADGLHYLCNAAVMLCGLCQQPHTPAMGILDFN